MRIARLPQFLVKATVHEMTGALDVENASAIIVTLSNLVARGEHQAISYLNTHIELIQLRYLR